MLKDNLDDLDENGHVGDWCFLNNDSLIAIRFREDRFTGTTIIPIADYTMVGKPHWEWNGDRESPTIEPSILVHKSFYADEWHGYLTNGKLITI